MRPSLTIITLLFQGLALCRGYERLWIYEPRSLVTDQAAIDLDLHIIKEQLAVGTSTSYITAEKVYREGAHSKSVADLSLDDPLDYDVPEGTGVIGIGKLNDLQVTGTVMEEAKKGDQRLLVQYSVNEVQANYVQCQVGANPEPNTKGCFASSGSITLIMMGGNLGYTYNITTRNFNFRTISGFSKDAKEEMSNCQNCPYDDYTKFFNYYGKHDYGDHIISSAFNGVSTQMTNGNMDFKLYNRKEGLTEVIKKAMAYMNVWMSVIRNMEDAIGRCSAGCTSNDDPGIQAWDEAVAFYIGSRGALPDNNGNLMFELADNKCLSFKTCGRTGKDIEGTAWVNYQVFRHFIDGQRHIVANDCDKARKAKEHIVRLMTIPLVQGTIRFAHIIAGDSTYHERHASEGAIFAMTVLPFIFDCDPQDAEIIYENMKATYSPNVNFLEVKHALERNYKCLNIKCAEVGGVYDDVLLEYKTHAHPCGFVSLASGMTKEQQQTAMAIGFSLAGLLVIAIVVCIVSRVSERNIQAQSQQPPQTDDPEISITEGPAVGH